MRRFEGIGLTAVGELLDSNVSMVGQRLADLPHTPRRLLAARVLEDGTILDKLGNAEPAGGATTSLPGEPWWSRRVRGGTIACLLVR